MSFEKDLENAMNAHWEKQEDDYSHDSLFDYAANWGHKWASDKGIGHLLTWSKDVHRKQLEKIRGMCGHPDASQACRNILEYCSSLTKEN